MANSNEVNIDINSKITANPEIVYREESDDWAILFNPENGHSFCLNPVTVIVWKSLNGKHTVKDLLNIVHKNCTNVPDEAENHIKEFLSSLLKQGLAK